MQPGAVLGEAWTLYKAHWLHLTTIALAFYVGLSLLSFLLVFLLGWIGVALGGLISLVGLFWLQGALVEAVSDIRDGRADLTLGQTVGRVGPRVIPIAAAGLLAGVGVAFGLVLLIVPGLVLLTWWIVIVPVLVLEDRGVLEAFGRSRELVRGHAWDVFGTIVLTILIYIAARFVLLILLAPFPLDLASFINSVVGNAVTAPLLALAWTLLYYRLVELRSEDVSAAAA
jgi:hypothetical protein